MTVRSSLSKKPTAFPALILLQLDQKGGRPAITIYYTLDQKKRPPIEPPLQTVAGTRERERERDVVDENASAAFCIKLKRSLSAVAVCNKLLFRYSFPRSAAVPRLAAKGEHNRTPCKHGVRPPHIEDPRT